MQTERTISAAVKFPIGVSKAARILNVSGQTVINACKRWRLGSRVYTGTGQRSVIVLDRKDVLTLAQRLQHGPGRPPTKRK